MKIFFDEAQLYHAPERAFHNGTIGPYREVALRAGNVATILGAPEAPADLGIEPLRAVHDPEYLDHLQSAYPRWLEAGRSGEALPYVWPIRRRRAIDLERIDALLGRFSYDATTPIVADTWKSAYASAQTALGAADAVIAGDRIAFALCRPPGHHAGADYMGGYCYLNNAAIAAQRASDAGLSKIAILDIDYHHGNGTQDIFWHRSDVLYVSIHGDPSVDYPFYWGRSDEVGEGEGQGYNLNLPLPHGTDLRRYRVALEQALARVDKFAPHLLVISFGADTFIEDPICGFSLRTRDFQEVANAIAQCDLPMVVIFEGGYAVDDLAANVSSFLNGLA